jgi:alkanesulfonate monooxygenase SsuD/methylene tetrahydromethanopterin reductase-like flavin-dependent oxidoreductase (luciferase family)
MGVDPRRRGQIMDDLLATLRTEWSGPNDESDFVAAPVIEDVPIMIGGTSDAAIRRTVQYGIGWIAGGAPPDALPPYVAKVKEAWHAAGREGEPRIAALAYYGLSDEPASRAALQRYYGFTGDFAKVVADSAARTPDAIRGAVAAFTDAGVDELIFDPTVADVAEVDRLADIVF